jgi:hypothetical protein
MKILRRGDIFAHDADLLLNNKSPLDTGSAGVGVADGSGGSGRINDSSASLSTFSSSKKLVYVAQGHVECLVLERELYIQYFIEHSYDVSKKSNSSRATSDKSEWSVADLSESSYKSMPTTARSNASSVTNISSYHLSKPTSTTGTSGMSSGGSGVIPNGGLHSILSTHNTYLSSNNVNTEASISHRASNKGKKVEISMSSLKLDTSESMIYSQRSSASVTTARSVHSDRGSITSDKNSVKSTARSVNFNDFDYPALKSGR